MTLRVRKPRDPRITAFAAELGVSREEAMGRLINLWEQCLDEKRDSLEPVFVKAHLGDKGVDALVSSGLGRIAPGAIQVAGARDEIEARARRTEAARGAGLASVATRTLRQRDVNATSTPRQSNVNATSTVLSDLRSDLFSSLSEASSPSETSGDLKQGRGKRQMPKDFVPPADIQALAALHRLDLGLEIEKCRDWHLSNGKLRSDWPATVRNWVRRAIEDRQKNGRAPTPDRKKPLQ